MLSWGKFHFCGNAILLAIGFVPNLSINSPKIFGAPITLFSSNIEGYKAWWFSFRMFEDISMKFPPRRFKSLFDETILNLNFVKLSKHKTNHTRYIYRFCDTFFKIKGFHINQIGVKSIHSLFFSIYWIVSDGSDEWRYCPERCWWFVDARSYNILMEGIHNHLFCIIWVNILQHRIKQYCHLISIPLEFWSVNRR